MKHIYYYNFAEGDICSCILALDTEYRVVFAQLGNDLNRMLQSAKIEFHKKGYKLQYNKDEKVLQTLQEYGKLLDSSYHKDSTEKEDGSDPLNLPIDYIFGTPLQREVWEQLRLIPCGETITYTELAHRVGRPAAVRPVASACNANNIAILVPCHRVVGKDGHLTGFKNGLEIKRKLITSENI